MLEKYKICTDLDLCLDQLERNSKLAVAISREHAHNYRLNSTKHFYCFQESHIIHEYSLKFLIRKDFSYLNKLNEFIQMAATSGLIEKWRTDDKIRNKYKSNALFYHQIVIENFGGFFIIWISIKMIIICTLIIEKVVYSKIKKPNPSPLWILLDKLIGPDRHFLLKNTVFK